MGIDERYDPESNEHLAHMLDEAGFNDMKITASNDLDEYKIKRLKEEGARIDIWGVGTRLATGGDQCALGGVYKLSCIWNNEKDEWDHKVKLSDDDIKVSNPCYQGVMRFKDGGKYIKDVIYDNDRDWWDENIERENLLVPIFIDGLN